MSRPLLVALALSLAACGSSSSSSSTSEPVTSSAGAEALPTPDVTGEEAHALVAGGAMLLDVTPAERADASLIEGRVNIPLPELEARMAEVPRDRPVVVYCLGGGGSPVAAQMLRAAGYTNVRLLGARANWDAPAATP